MSDPMTMKWAIVDLLKICDAAHEGRLHGDLARIARTLGVELTSPVIEAPAATGAGHGGPIDLGTRCDAPARREAKKARSMS
jgi:hypothetical protein